MFFSFNSLLVLVQIRASKKDTEKVFFPFNSQPIPVVFEQVKKTEKNFLFQYFPIVTDTIRACKKDREKAFFP